MTDAGKVEVLKKQRAAYKGQLTNFRTQLTTVSTLGGLESILNRIQSINEKYDAVQSKLELVDDIYLVDRASFDEYYLEFEATLRDKIHDLKRSEDTSNTTSFHNTSMHELTSNNPAAVSIRLPEITLPVFNGVELDWLGFRDVFIDLIHSKTLDPTVKFLYLISSIRTGKAFSFIENLPVTASNYEIVWTTLCDHYNNEISIQRIHTRELYDVRTPQENSSRSLQSFIDTIVKHVSALNSLKVNVKEWDLLLVHHVTQRLDNLSRIFIAKNTKPNKALSLKDIIELLRSRVRIIEVLSTNSTQVSSRMPKNYKAMSFNVSAPANAKCLYCTGPHILPQCPVFSSERMSPRTRFNFIKDHRMCGNCLLDRHFASQCSSPRCSKCSLRHHDLLHFEPIESTTNRGSNDQTLSQSSVVTCNDLHQEGCVPSPDPVCSTSDVSRMVRNMVLIGTALVNASAHQGLRILCRVLLDSGSTLNFVTEHTCRLLRAKLYPTSKTITGIGAVESRLNHKIYLTISSRVSNFSTVLKFYVLPKITNHIPSVQFKIPANSLSKNFVLADPLFNEPDRIDLLIGAEIYNELFKGPAIKIHNELPPLYDSVFGYVICGKSQVKINCKDIQQSHVALCSIQTLETQIKQFWELETYASKPLWSQEEAECEEHYKTNVSRTAEGRYIVRLPTKPNLAYLGSSYYTAHRQFLSLEHRLQNNSDIYNQYVDFMKEYSVLGHMRQVHHDKSNRVFYLPHHCVLKEKSSTTKLRVVFNASSKTSSHTSLNDCLMVGPTIQPTLFSIILRFRKHDIAFCGDITKMYRQILVREDQQGLQRILWRNQATDELHSFNLTTVTYGTACAPFLATRTLKQLAMDEITQFPRSSKILTNDFYIDDVLTGASTVHDALMLRNELTELLRLGGFELRKFVSNSKELSSSESSQPAVTLVLGLMWNTVSDCFELSFNKLPVTSVSTKRTILSEICQLFDPLGICAPIILTAKLMMQTIWTLQDANWDDPLPANIVQHWNKFKLELHMLQCISTPRLITSSQGSTREIHGFCDASERAYGCVIYIRTLTPSNLFKVSLLCSKSRVAPLKKETIPRLELCAAVLLSEVVSKVTKTLDLKIDSVFLWTDSKITLFRINSEPYKYTTFVANRLTKIQELTSITDWRYVATSENPAELVSRGLMPSQFKPTSIWWTGPNFLKTSSSSWSTSGDTQCSQESRTLERRQSQNPVLLQNQFTDDSIVFRFSSATLLIHVVAYMIRFTRNARNRVGSTMSILLQPCEIINATAVLVKLVQRQMYQDEVASLSKSRHLSLGSKLHSLSPFLDKDGILRVGGRLNNANISIDQKHPMVLPGRHPFTSLIVKNEHLRLLHAGPQALLYNLRLSYWIVGVRNLCRKIVHECIQCFHVKRLIQNQIMGELPRDRITKLGRAFSVVGIDFCGPIYFVQSSRAKTKHKGFICLFVCFTTKAVHLEMVMNLSTESFIACLKRFVSRRGICTKIYSDNATNFIGARKELLELKTLFLNQSFQQSTTQFCTLHSIEWATIPPRSPHFGGLWESAVKSAKYHLKRVIGIATVTLEELSTLLAQTEACLNSRPLTPLSSDPTDLTVTGTLSHWRTLNSNS